MLSLPFKRATLLLGLFVVIVLCGREVMLAHANSQKYPVVQDTPFRSSSSSSNELTNLAKKNDFIYLNTIDGVLYAIGKHDGAIKWSIKEEAVLKFPKDYENPYFLTDPRDGSLYIFTNEGDGLKKFPYTIAELVSASPSKSSDGYLYTGDKKDQWIAIDYRTGKKMDTLTAETLSSKISVSDENVLFIGRTQYTITMFETNSMKKVFNLTYFDYSTHAHKSSSSSSSTPNKPTPQSANINKDKDKESSPYPYYHFSSSSDGTLVTVDKRTGELVWELKLDHPVIAMYRYESEQLFKINFVIFAVEALTNLNPNRFKMLHAEQKQLEQEALNVFSQQQQRKTNLFVSSLYIGNYKKNLYAIPALVYNWHMPSLEGPSITDLTNKPNETGLAPGGNSNANQDANSSGSNSMIIPGHRRLPDKFIPPPNYIQPNNKLIVISNNNNNNNNDDVSSLSDIFGATRPQPLCPVDKPSSNKSTRDEKVFTLFRLFDQLMSNKYFWTVFTVLLGSALPLIRSIYNERRKKKRRQLAKLQQITSPLDSSDLSNVSTDDDDDKHHNSPNTNRTRDASRHSSKNSSLHNRSSQKKSLNNSMDEPWAKLHSFSSPEFGADGLIKIGKITYDPTQKLGHGCSGTIVYKGFFENRPVAVKRLLPECYTLADREVELLKHADQHANVLRYFCTESDSQFRYIALEMCQMTLHEYIHNQYNLDFPPRAPFRLLSILEQASKGLDHLHALDIVHRDIKPHNVLISFPDHKGQVFAMISDFGLCKKLEMGINSFSKKSGILGTEGWIAPELLDEIYGSIQEQFDANSDSGKGTNSDSNEPAVPKRVTKSVDIFSMGCVYYFVLTGGIHPFGDSLRRQANILNNEYKTDKLSSVNTETYMQRNLIERMISKEPKDRPSSKQILAHPVFWSKAKILQFLQDVSDRIEKIDMNDPILAELERSANVILRNNWKVHICPNLQDNLKKFRTYNGVCVRDLLRAIRNKKHHYRELPPDVAASLGTLPDEFVDYFTSRFPKLILHVYEALRGCADEPMLDVYYNMWEHHF